MARYAANTEVSVDKTRAEIEKTLTRYGATSFSYGWQPLGAAIMFEARGRRIRFVLPLPSADSPEFERDGRGALRTPRSRAMALEKIQRQKWRALALVIKAKLEAVESKIVTFEDEFLAHTVMPDGRNFSEHAQPAIKRALTTHQLPPLLPDFTK